MDKFDEIAAKIAAMKGCKKLEAIAALAGEPDPHQASSVTHLHSSVRSAAQKAEYTAKQSEAANSNAQILLILAKTQKGDVKDAALRALASLNSPVASELWQEMVAKKGWGEKVLTGATGEAASDAVAGRAEALFRELASKHSGYTMTDREFNEYKAMITMMCGKASAKMAEIYCFVAANLAKFSALKTPKNSLGKPDGVINRYLNLTPNSREQTAKIFPITLAISLVLNLDERLIELANKLDERYGGGWLTARFVASLLTRSKAEIFEEFAPMLSTERKLALLDALALLFYEPKSARHVVVANWGRYEYAQIDTVVYEKRMLCENLDERWYEALTTTPSVSVSPQAYTRTYVSYGAYDELLASLVPDAAGLSERAREGLVRYFLAGEASYDGASSVYIDTLNRLGADVSEAMMMKFINCKANAISEHSLPVALDHFTSWSVERRLKFYESLPKRLVKAGEIARLKGLA